MDSNFRARKEILSILWSICRYIYHLKHPTSPTTGNWLSYAIFNTIYWCLLYLKVWSDSSGVHYLGMTTCTWGKLVTTNWAWTGWPFPIPYGIGNVIKLFSLWVDYISRSKAGLRLLAGYRITNIFSVPQNIWIKLRLTFSI